MIKLVLKGIKQRKKEIRYVVLVTFMAVFFMAAINLYQSIMDNYIYQNNLSAYGEWVVSSVSTQLKHPYFSLESGCTTGINIVDENGVSQNIYMGNADENFELIDGDSLYEGHMPQNDNEIAMDIVSLAQLGYHYELGQMITIRYADEEGNIYSKEYELVGTLKCLAEIWNVDEEHPLPNIFLTENEFDTYEGITYTTYFYQLDEKYKDISTVEFAKSFMGNDKNVTYNTYVYENRFWDSIEVYEKVEVVLMTISLLGISYLLVSYTGKRRGEYYRYRCIGASKGQVRRIILTECVYATLPGIAAGMFSAYIIAYVICELIAASKNMNNFFIFDIMVFVKQLLAVFLVVLIAIIAAQISNSDKRLSGNTGAIKPSKYRRLRKVALRTRKPEKTIFKRQNVIRPVQRIVSGVFSMIVCGSLVFCAYKINQTIEYGNNVLSMLDDFKMRKTMDMVYEFETEDGTQKYTWVRESMYEGADENFMDELERCPGVEHIDSTIIDYSHYFQWDGIEESPVIKMIEGGAQTDSPYEYDMAIRFYEDADRVKEKVAMWENSDIIDWKAFEKGEEIILIVNESFYSFDDLSTVEVKDTTIKNGDMIDVINIETGDKLSVKAGLVYYVKDLTPIDEFYTGSYKMIGSREFAEKIAESEGKSLKYNNIIMEYDENASYQSTDKQLAMIANRYGMRYGAESEEKRIVERDMINDISAYATVFIMILVVFIAIQRNIIVSKNKYWEKRFAVLKQIGMEDGQYARSAFVAECKSLLWMIAGLIPGYMLVIYGIYQEAKTVFVGEITVVYSSLSGKFIESEYDYIMNALQWETEHGLFIGIVLLLYLVMVLSAAVIIRRIVKGGKIK